MYQMLQRVQDRQNVNYSTQNNDQHEVLLSLFSVRYTIILEILAVNKTKAITCLGRRQGEYNYVLNLLEVGHAEKKSLLRCLLRFLKKITSHLFQILSGISYTLDFFFRHFLPFKLMDGGRKHLATESF